jgi:hypothetical protein
MFDVSEMCQLSLLPQNQLRKEIQHIILTITRNVYCIQQSKSYRPRRKLRVTITDTPRKRSLIILRSYLFTHRI